MHFDATIFDLDGVVTDTAAVHAAAWRQMSDAYLSDRAESAAMAFEPFRREDYLSYVDGRPRYEGVDGFLKSRGIVLPYGDLADSLERETVCGLGNRKDAAFNRVLKAEGVQVYGSTIVSIGALRRSGVQAGARGRFGPTRGVARENNGEALRRHGADMVVRDLSEISLEDLDNWFENTLRTKPDVPEARLQ